MAAAVSSPRGTSPNVDAPPVTVENAVKSTSARTTVRTEEPAPRHAQVHTLAEIVTRALHVYLYNYISNIIYLFPLYRCSYLSLSDWLHRVQM